MINVLMAPNTANAPNQTDSLYADQSNMALDMAFEFVGIGVGKVVARFVFDPVSAAVSPYVRRLFNRVSKLGRSAPSVSTPIPAEQLLLRGPAQITLNQAAGNQFQNAVRASLRTAGGRRVVSPAGVVTIPDLPVGNLFGVTDIKNVISISRRSQLRAQIGVADSMGLPFNLIISPRTVTVSVPLQREIIRTGGAIFEFDDVAGVFRSVSFTGNQVVR